MYVPFLISMWERERRGPLEVIFSEGHEYNAK
jgi:hypothetical protein